MSRPEIVVLLSCRSLVPSVAGRITGAGALLWSAGTHRYIKSGKQGNVVSDLPGELRPAITSTGSGGLGSG